MTKCKNEEYNLQKFNNDIKELIKSELVNNIELFVSSGKSLKLSVTLHRYKDQFNDRYHGLHPEFDDSKLKEYLFRKDCFAKIKNFA